MGCGDAHEGAQFSRDALDVRVGDGGFEREEQTERIEEFLREVLLVRQQTLTDAQEFEDGALGKRTGGLGASHHRPEDAVDVREDDANAVAVTKRHAHKDVEAKESGVVVDARGGRRGMRRRTRVADDAVADAVAVGLGPIDGAGVSEPRGANERGGHGGQGLRLEKLRVGENLVDAARLHASRRARLRLLLRLRRWRLPAPPPTRRSRG